MRKLTWPALVIAAAIVIVGTWGSTVSATAKNTGIRVVTAGAAKATNIEVSKAKTVAKTEKLNILPLWAEFFSLKIMKHLS